MIFNHNFIHGDLHPGNILWTASNQLAYIDAGMCVEIGDDEHRDMVGVLTNFIQYKGYDAAKIMLKSSESQKAKALSAIVVTDAGRTRPEPPTT